MFKLSTKRSVSNILFRGAPRQVIPVLLAACSVRFPLQLAPFICFAGRKHGDKFALSCLLVPLPPAYSAVHYSTHFLCLTTRERRPISSCKLAAHARTFRHGTHSPMWCPINVKLFPGRLRTGTVGVTSYRFKNES